MNFVENFDIRKLPGIGPQSEDVLKGLGINTVKDMRERLFDLFILYHDYHHFISYANKCYGISNVNYDLT